MRRTFLATAPPWLVTVLDALVGIAFLTIGWATTEHGSWPSSFVFACLVTAFGGPFVWTGVRRARREISSITGPLTRAQQQSVYQAAATGVPPTEPALHRVALDLARYQLDTAVRQRTGMIVVCVIMLGVAVLCAITDRSVWLAVCAILILGMLVRTLLYPARQRRRVERLDGRTACPTVG